MPETVSYLSPNALKPHPRNEEFFSNIEGEDYERLKQSISELGVLTPLRVASDMTIISGHQRYRAANELGFNQVPVVIDENLHDEDDKLQQLIASNFGRLKNDPIKQAKWLKEYERLRGVRQGGGGRYAKELRHNVAISQEVIAKELGVDRRTLQRLKKLLDIYPEMQQLISAGKISVTTGSRLIARLTEEEQKELLAQLPAAGKLTSSEVQKYVDKIKGLKAEKKEAEARIAELKKEAESNESKAQIGELESKLDELQAENERLARELDKASSAAAGTTEDCERLRSENDELRMKLMQTEAEKMMARNNIQDNIANRERADFRNSIRMFDSEIRPTAEAWPDYMNDYNKDDRDECIERMESIIGACKKIIEHLR